MKRILFLFFMMVGSVYAESTTPNLIGGNWNSVVTGTHPNNCCTGGPAPLYDPNTGIIHFSYGTYAVHQAIAINQALSGSGVQINGWNWGYDLRNMNGTGGGQNGTDTVSVTSYMTNNMGQLVGRSDQYYNTQFDWTRFSGTEILPSPLSLENSGSLGIQFVSRDAGFWAGYYGPQVQNVTLSANYTAVPIDPCVNDPLSSPSCPGYQQAYHDQQCAANPLYAVSCPGYQQAYYTQQCSINPLYDSGCPGYQQAYFNQQCTNDPLYNNQCPGYAQAYYTQQCSINPLYDQECNGYAQAVYNQQCSNNALYDSGCPGYKEAFVKKQLLDQQNTKSTTQTVAVPTITEPTIQLSTKGEVSTDVPLVADPVVNEILKESAKVEMGIAQESLPAPSQQTTTIAPAQTQSAEQKQEQKKTDTEIAKVEKKSDSKSNREKVKEAMTEKAKELANEMSNAATLEAQAANQGLVLGLMNYNPGFSAYANAIIPDTGAIDMARQYDKPVVDNRRALRIMNGASDRLHQEMVNEQYK